MLILFCNTNIIKAQYNIFLLIGQSNMAGRADIEDQDTATLTNVFLFNDNNTWERAGNPLNIYSTIRKDVGEQKLGPGYTFAKSVLDSLELITSLGLVVNARGGTTISEWQKGGTYYNESLSRIQSALSTNLENRLLGILWHQGESDYPDPSGYTTDFKRMINDFRNDLSNETLPVFVGEVGKWDEMYNAINTELSKTPDSVSNCYLVSSDGLTNKDIYHFDSESQRELGVRYAQKVLEVVSFEDPVSADGMQQDKQLCDLMLRTNNQVLTIESFGGGLLQIFDMNGKYIYENVLSKDALFEMRLNRGFYIISVLSDKCRIVKKIVI